MKRGRRWCYVEREEVVLCEEGEEVVLCGEGGEVVLCGEGGGGAM